MERMQVINSSQQVDATFLMLPVSMERIRKSIV